MALEPYRSLAPPRTTFHAFDCKFRLLLPVNPAAHRVVERNIVCVSKVRLAEVEPRPRRLMPCEVGLATSELERRNSSTPGIWRTYPSMEWVRPFAERLRRASRGHRALELAKRCAIRRYGDLFGGACRFQLDGSVGADFDEFAFEAFRVDAKLAPGVAFQRDAAVCVGAAQQRAGCLLDGSSRERGAGAVLHSQSQRRRGTRTRRRGKQRHCENHERARQYCGQERPHAIDLGTF